jgi:Outer membrane protein beta-barrel domain
VVLVALLGAVICASSASAQERGKYELSAGYAHLRVDSSKGGLSLNGLDFSLARNVNGWLAVTGDVGGYHLEGFRLGTYMFGPRFTARVARKASFFGQALFGGSHAQVAAGRGFPTYHDSVAWSMGGGLDYRLNARIALRLGQVEYVQTRLGGAAQHNLRAGAGVVFSFGARGKR